MSNHPETKTYGLNENELPVEYAEQLSTIYIDGMQGIQGANGIAKIGLYQLILDLQKLDQQPNPPVKKQIFGHLVMSEPALRAVRDWLISLELGPSDDKG